MARFQIRLIFLVPFQGKGLRNIVEHYSLLFDILNKGSDPFRRQLWELFQSFGPSQHVPDFCENLCAEKQDNLIIVDELKTLAGRAFGSAGSLQKDHAIKNHARVHPGLPCFSCQTCSRLSSKKRSTSSSVIG